jgi:LacI family transcriptional regulator
VTVTIKQIAELASVSRGTVDKVLNNRPGVKAATKNKILKIAEELDYKPNYIGKRLVQIKDKLKIGVILTPEYNPFVHEIIHGINRAQEEFEHFGLEITTKMLSTLEPAEQIGILNYFENEKYTGIAVFPINDKQVIQKINQLSSNGTAIITFNSQIEEINDICFIGQDHYKGGRTAAGLLKKLLPNGGDVGVIISTRNLSCHQDRLRGFTDKIHETYPEMNIVEINENQDRKEDAFKIMLKYLNTYQNLRGVYITGGGVAGIGNALNIAEKTGTVKVICHDLTPDSVELLKSRTVDFAIAQNPEFQGYSLIKFMFEYLVKNQKPSTKKIEIPLDIETEDTI